MAAKRGKKRARKRPSRKTSSKRFRLLRLLFRPFGYLWLKTKKKPAWLKWPIRLAFTGLALALLGFILLTLIFYPIAWTYDLKEVEVMPARTEILDRHGNILKNTTGQEIGYLHGKNRRMVTFQEVSPNFIKALIATEDRRFRQHGAVDFRAFARVAHRLVTRGKLEGGGTITMQLARNSYTLKKRDEKLLGGIYRKILETYIAVRIEQNFTKDEILQHYMNRIFWGGSIRGIEVASRTYLNKSARDLTISEAAMLAGIIRAPNRFSPFRSEERAERQRDWVLTKMVQNGDITPAEADTARSQPLDITSAQARIQQGSYALDAIRRDLDRILEKENLRDGGLIITTTIDPQIQQVAERSMERRLAQIENRRGFPHPKRSAWNRQGDPNYLQGASVVIDNATGAVLSIVGGRNANESQFHRALQARRSVGSLFKPFMFLAAFAEGVQPDQMVSDARLRPGELRDGDPNWSPANADRKYYQKVPVSQALVASRNTSSIRVANVAGLDKVIEVARQAGFDTDRIDRVPSSYLGSWGATPEEVTSAFTIFPNGGTRFRPYYIQSIKNQQGETLFENGPIDYQATPATPAWEVSRILEEVNRSGTGRAIRSTFGFRAPSGGKTGTTNGPNDAWYAGYTSAMTCAVWVGMDDNSAILPSGSGASLALPVWVDIMKAADRLPNYQNGNIAPGRAVIVNPSEADIPEALPVN